MSDTRRKIEGTERDARLTLRDTEREIMMEDASVCPVENMTDATRSALALAIARFLVCDYLYTVDGTKRNTERDTRTFADGCRKEGR